MPPFLNVGLVAIVGGGIFYLLVSQVVQLISDLPALMGKFSYHLESARVFIDENLGIPYTEQPKALENRVKKLFDRQTESIGKGIGSLVKTIVALGILPVYVFLMLYYRERFTKFINMVYPASRQQAVGRTITEAAEVVQKYIGGMTIVTAIVMVMVFGAFLILNVKNALLFAAFIAIFNLIPYVGVVLASLISVIYVYLTKDNIMYPIITIILLWGIQLVENNLITPFIVGRQIRLNPLVIIAAIILGGMIWGISGMILFIPMLGALKVILDEIPSLRPYGYLLGDDKENRRPHISR